MLTLEQLLAEREALADELIAAQKKPENEDFAEALRKMTCNYIEALKLAINPTPQPVAFVAIFALGLMRTAILHDVPEAEESEKLLADLWDTSSTTIKTPRIKRKEEDTD